MRSFSRVKVSFNTVRECGISRGVAMSRDFFVRQEKALEVVAVSYVKSALTQHDGKRPGMGAARLVSCSRR